MEALALALAWLLPLGIALVGMGLRKGEGPQQVAVALPLALCAAGVGYLTCGYALHHGELEWQPLRALLGEGWGLAGVGGWLLPWRQPTAAQWALLLDELPRVTVAALIPLMALRGRAPAWMQALLALWASALAYPLAGHWAQGPGWLAQLGPKLGLGHALPVGALGLPCLVGGLAALAGLLAVRAPRREAYRQSHGKRALTRADAPSPATRERVAGVRDQALPSAGMRVEGAEIVGARSEKALPPEAALPEAHLPLMVLIGAWCVWLSVGPSLNSLAALVGATLGALFYSLLIHGRPEPGLMGRALVAALVFTSAGTSYYALEVCLAAGAACGFALGPALYLFERTLRLEDDAAAGAALALPAAGGLLLVGLAARGAVTGWWAGDPAAGLEQLLAQAIALGALAILAGVLPWCLLELAHTLVDALRALARPSQPKEATSSEV